MAEAKRSQAALEEAPHQVSGVLVKTPRTTGESLPAAVSVGLGDTAGGESSSRPGAEGEPVRALEVSAKGGFGGFQNTNSL